MPCDRLLTLGEAVKCLQDGEVIAYPTEAVYGLGCDPRNEKAVRKVLALKQRSAEAGLILIADEFERFSSFAAAVPGELENRARATWPGPVTWLFPRGETVPDWLAGNHATIALRVTAHPVCRALCAAFKGAIVSTSANTRKTPPARTAEEVHNLFGSKLCGTLAGELGFQSKPSEIRDLATGRVVREG